MSEREEGVAIYSWQVEINRLTAELKAATKLIRELSDDEECWLDHHDGCQEHGYLSLRCPNQDAREWIDAHPDE